MNNDKRVWNKPELINRNNPRIASALIVAAERGLSNAEFNGYVMCMYVLSAMSSV